MKEEETICIGVRITKELHKELAKCAKAKDLNISQLVRLAIKKIINGE